MAGLKVLAKTSQKISIGADTFRLKVSHTGPWFSFICEKIVIVNFVSPGTELKTITF